MKRYLMALLLCIASLSSSVAQELSPQYRANKEMMARTRMLTTASQSINSDSLELFVGDLGNFTLGIPDGPILVFGHPGSTTSVSPA